MKEEIPIAIASTHAVNFTDYETKFKALADQKRLQIIFELCQQGQVCVCDLCSIVDMPQSKLSYHLKILLDANLIHKETRGTWSYYEMNHEEVNNLLSPVMCCIFRNVESSPKNCCSSD